MSGLGYECGECGYVPTEAETQSGTCPVCWERRRREREALKKPSVQAAPRICPGCRAIDGEHNFGPACSLMEPEPEPEPRAEESERPWTYHRGMPDRSGLADFTHLIRWKHDPKETVARGAKAREAGLRAPGSAKRAGGSVPEARAAIEKLLSDGEPRTFHCIAVQLVGLDASAVVGSPLELALWDLVKDETLAWACEEDVVFWTLARFVDWG